MPLPTVQTIEEGNGEFTLANSWLSPNGELVLYWEQPPAMGSVKLSYQPSTRALPFLIKAFTHLDLGDFFPKGGEKLDGKELNEKIHNLLEKAKNPIVRTLNVRSQVGADGISRLVPRMP